MSSKEAKGKGKKGNQSRIEIKVNMIWCWWVVLYERGSMLHGVAFQMSFGIKLGLFLVPNVLVKFVRFALFYTIELRAITL